MILSREGQGETHTKRRLSSRSRAPKSRFLLRRRRRLSPPLPLFSNPNSAFEKKRGGEGKRERAAHTHTLLSLLAGDLPNLNIKISNTNSKILLFSSFLSSFLTTKKPVPIIILRKRSHYVCNLERMRKTIHGKRKEMFCRAFVNGC